MPTTHGTGSEVDRYAVISDHKERVKRGFCVSWLLS
ncbi:MAG: iron-containing alcohol dehydrogenase [Thermoproteales archaeon]|nr:iron-containing alcohol dehydrogenase [Thermoproteales archaeon]